MPSMSSYGCSGVTMNVDVNLTGGAVSFGEQGRDASE